MTRSWGTLLAVPDASAALASKVLFTVNLLANTEPSRVALLHHAAAVVALTKRHSDSVHVVSAGLGALARISESSANAARLATLADAALALAMPHVSEATVVSSSLHMLAAIGMDTPASFAGAHSLANPNQDWLVKHLPFPSCPARCTCSRPSAWTRWRRSQARTAWRTRTRTGW